MGRIERARDIGELRFPWEDDLKATPPAPAEPPSRSLSRRKLLAVGAVTALLGLGLGGADPTGLRPARNFRPRAAADLPRPWALGDRRMAQGIPVVRTKAADGVGRLVVASAGIDVTPEAAALDAEGNMVAPDGPGAVAWYRFSGVPGASSNVLFAGHVSWRTGEPAAFRRLAELREGAPVDVTDSMGRLFVYRVFASFEVDPKGGHVEGLLGPQPRPICTLISCDGWFDAGTGQYTKRRIVQAAL
jgi:hypothetical protein